MQHMDSSTGWTQWMLWPGRVRGYATTQSVVESTRSTTNTKYWIWGSKYWMSPSSWTSPDDQMDGIHLRTPDESMSMEDTDSHSEDEDSHTPHVV